MEPELSATDNTATSKSLVAVSFKQEHSVSNLTDSPAFLKPFIFHGVDISAKDGTDQAQGTCPFCAKAKFFVNTDTGLWDCKSCVRKGNVTMFLRQLWEESDKATTDYKALATDRKLVYGDTLTHWGVANSIAMGEWLVPGAGIDGKVGQLYRYTKEPNSKKRFLMATPEVHHQLHGMTMWDASRRDVYICEGPWDGMALWETMKSAKKDAEGALSFTASLPASMLSGANVIATPGANVFPDHWVPLLAGKRVFLLFDNDHPRTNNGTLVDGAGLAGMKKVCEAIASADAGDQPSEIYHIQWGDETWHDEKVASGYDVRDYLVAGGDIRGRVARLQGLLEKLRPVPPEWLVNRGSKKGTEVQPMPCGSWKVLESAFRKALKWNAGLDRALCVMLSCILSTETSGDQLWCKIIGPASCGKSTLCEAVTVAQKYVLAKSTIRGFHSGFKATGDDKKKDTSLIDQLRNKTLVTKDGDTLLQAPNLGQILAEARDIYDRTSRTHYRNEMGRDYNGVNMTWILCGTASLRSIDSSELGERFFDSVIMNTIDDDVEDDIMDRVALRVIRNMRTGKEGLKAAGGIGDTDMLKAYRLTGGYIEHLKVHGDDLLASVEVSDEALALVKRLAKFVACVRARPSENQDESAEREFSTRLLSQLLRLAMCLAVVRGEPSLDGIVMTYVRDVALDTARGVTYDILNHLYSCGVDGTDPKPMAMITNQTDERQAKLLRFMKRLGIVETFVKEVTKGLKSRPRWRMTEKMTKLWEDVVQPHPVVSLEEEADES